MLPKEHYFIEDLPVMEETEVPGVYLEIDSFFFFNLSGVFKKCSLHGQKDREQHECSSKIPRQQPMLFLMPCSGDSRPCDPPPPTPPLGHLPYKSPSPAFPVHYTGCPPFGSGVT